MDEIATYIDEEVVMQIGNTNYLPKNCKYHHFLTNAEMADTIKKSKVVVCQGAMSAIDSLLLGTPVIVVPRQLSQNEVINNHQSVFAEKLKEINLILLVEDIDKLDDFLLNKSNYKFIVPK